MKAELIAEIKARVGLRAQLERDGVTLSKKGEARCPFHNEKTASFSIKDAEGVYYCFGCQAKGDVVTWMMAIHGLTFRDAMVELASIAGVEIPADYGKPERPNYGHRTSLYDANDWACTWFERQLDSAATDYLADRCVTLDVIQRFRIGVAPKGWHALEHALRGKPYAEVAHEAGLLTRDKDAKPRDMFVDRLMMPVMALSGRVAGFCGRARGDFNPKYLNTTETAIYDKGSLLFGLYQARPAIQQRRACTLVEGNVDVLALHSAGFATAVAPCGTALTPEHVRLLSLIHI